MTIEEIEKDMRRARTPAAMDELVKWLASRPFHVQEAARNFPPYQLYLVQEGAPYRYTVAGSVVSPLSFVEKEEGGKVDIRFRVLQSPIGRAGVAAVIDPQFLEPITLDDLKEMREKEASLVN